MTFARKVCTGEIGSMCWIGLLEVNVRTTIAAFQRKNVFVIKNSLLNVFYFHTPREIRGYLGFLLVSGARFRP